MTMTTITLQICSMHTSVLCCLYVARKESVDGLVLSERVFIEGDSCGKFKARDVRNC